MRHALATLSLAVFLPALVQGEDPIRRLVFGSCAKESRPQPIWDHVLAANPDLFIFAGDNIYGDTQDMKVLQQKYQQLSNQPGFQKLLVTCPVLATWDDHDYGMNDAGKEYPQRAESQRIFQEFWKVPGSRSRPGIYDSYIFGPEGKRLQVILLDTRYFRDKPEERTKEERKALRLGPYKPSKNQELTMLGDRQWQWLEDQLQVPAELRVIVSSIQVVSGEHGWETWGNMPHERERLYDLVEKYGGIFFLSGDRHLSELSCHGPTPERHYRIYDFTSSGLTEAFGGREDEPNKHRLKLMRAHNFGAIEIDWDSAEPGLQFVLYRVNIPRSSAEDQTVTSEVAFRVPVKFGELRVGAGESK